MHLFHTRQHYWHEVYASLWASDLRKHACRHGLCAVLWHRRGMQMPFSVPLDIESSDPRAASFTSIHWQHSRLIWNAALVRLDRTGQLGSLRAASLHFSSPLCCRNAGCREHPALSCVDASPCFCRTASPSWTAPASMFRAPSTTAIPRLLRTCQRCSSV